MHIYLTHRWDLLSTRMPLHACDRVLNVLKCRHELANADVAVFGRLVALEVVVQLRPERVVEIVRLSVSLHALVRLFTRISRSPYTQ